MKKVQVLMSVYNGGERIYRQVNSILNQIGVNTFLIIRDDGSDQETINILKDIDNRYGENVRVMYGTNIGYKKSFLSLISSRDTADYYAFSDQDDLWEEDKLLNAVEMLDKSKNKIKLYTSSIGIYSENLVKMRISDISKVPNNIESLFTRTRFAGCTFVFSSELADITTGYESLDYKDNEMPDHDFLVASFAYTYGKVIVDFKSHIKHIRYDNSVTSGGNGIKKRLQVELYNTFKKKNIRFHMAQILLNFHDSNDSYSMSEGTFAYLNSVVEYRQKISDRINFILNQKIDCGNSLCNLETKLKIMLGKY